LEKDEPRGVLVAGTRLRNYELVSVLGQGSFGITYRARDTALSRDVAIKEYLPTSLALRENGTVVLPRSTNLAEEFLSGRRRFVEEAQTLAKLDHAFAVVRVYDFLEANGTAYMVMALAKGETLQHQIDQGGPLSPEAIDRILGPLLDSLEQVHGVGFLHRDIKPANIILNSDGSPTLIDFGASRASLAGRTTAMTAIFTPGYAAAEQFTSAKQGPWTDIYGLSATIHHAITGHAPPSAFDRMLDDTYEPLATLRPAGFAIGLLAGIDAGLAVRAFERPQSIEGWRSLLTQSASPGSPEATVVMQPRSAPTTEQPPRPAVPPQPSSPPPPTGSRSKRLAIYGGLAAAAIAMAVVAYLVLAPSARSPPQTVAVQDLKAEDLQKLLDQRRKADEAAAEKRRLEEEVQRKAEADATTKTTADAELATAQRRRQKAEEELAQLKAEMAARQQQDASQKEQADAVARRATEETAQRKAEAEMIALRQAEENAKRKAVTEAETKRQTDEALAKARAERQKADEEAANRQRAEEAATKQKADADTKQKADADAAMERKTAEAGETALSLTQADRQHIQVALTSQGFDTRGNDGALGPRSREMIANWQKARNQPPTGYLNRAQQQALLKEAAAAVSRYDDEQKKIEDDRKTAEELKRKADEEARTRATAPTSQSAPVPSAPPASSASQYDGKWIGDIGAWHVILSVTGTTGSLSLSCTGAPEVLPVEIKDGRFRTYIRSHSGRQEIDGKLPSLTIAPNTFCNGGSGTLTR
jgi:serine/threonine protein kinase/peptidoglycan hydrolase-like protein with peptidoglycan-binding domain